MRERIPYTVVIGDAEGMEPAVGASVAVSQRVDVLSSVSELVMLAAECAPDLIIICQHWPDEYTRAEVENLIETFPLARLICCYGPWCASEGRTRATWPAAVRVSLDDVPARIRREADVIFGKRPPLQLTAGLDEIFAFDNG